VVAGDGRGATYYYEAVEADAGCALRFNRAALYDDPASMPAEVKLYDIDGDGELEVLGTVYDTSQAKDSSSGSVFIWKMASQAACLEDSDCQEGFCVDNVCVPAQVDKCKVKAGKNGKGDSMQFSGLLDVTTADFDAAMGGDVVVIIEADDIPDLDVTTFKFPLEEGSVKKGKYKAPKVKPADKTDPTTSLQIDSIKGKMKFSGKNLDLTGLSCPITITIQIGDYTAEIVLDEDIVNGPKKPCPPELMEGI